MKSLQPHPVALVLSLLVSFTSATAQFGEIRLPLIATDSTPVVDSVHFGLHPLASRCVDLALGEWEIPPDICCGLIPDLCVSLVDPPPQLLDCLGAGVRLDLRHFWSTTQADTYYVRFCGVDPIVFHWPSYIGRHFDSCKARDPFGGMLFNIDMATTDSLLIPPGLTSFLIFTYGPRGTTGILSEEQLPTTNSLSQNFPNPFNPSTTVTYQLASNSHVTLVVFDLLGRDVLTLLDRTEEPGVKCVRFDAGTLSAGVYFYRLIADGFVQTRKMIIQK
jgi:hypothetical protein